MYKFTNIIDYIEEIYCIYFVFLEVNEVYKDYEVCVYEKEQKIIAYFIACKI